MSPLTQPLQDDSRIVLAVVLACYNRKKTTLKCLGSLYQSVPSKVDATVFLFDDASPDGTASAVREHYPDVRIVEGDGKQFWCGGMRAAMFEAAKVKYDFLLWLNDDVDLAENFLDVLFASHDRAMAERGNGLNVIIGAVADPVSGALTYSGYRRTSKIHPAKLVKIAPNPLKLLPCDAMNGNCVLFPAQVVAMVGEIEPAYEGTQLGDVDYGYRCVESGAGLWLAPTYVGKCLMNARVLAWQNNALSFIQRCKLLNTPHGMPIRPWLHFMFRFGGPAAVILLFWSYLKWLTISLLPLHMRPRFSS